jgi:hypothetical protein
MIARKDWLLLVACLAAVLGASLAEEQGSGSRPRWAAVGVSERRVFLRGDK